MPEHVHHIVKRLILYICICLLAGIGISGMTAFFHTSFSSTSSILFPLLTSFLMVFHITIACFMGMKYWSANSTPKCNTRQIKQPVVVHQTRSAVA